MVIHSGPRLGFMARGKEAIQTNESFKFAPKTTLELHLHLMHLAI